MGIQEYIQDPNSRALLSWLGSGLVVVFGAGWAVVKLIYGNKKKSAPGAVVADHGSVASGRDIRDTKIDMRHSGKS